MIKFLARRAPPLLSQAAVEAAAGQAIDLVPAK